MVNARAVRQVLAIAFAALASTAAHASPNEPPVEVKGRISALKPPPPPQGFNWVLLDELGAAVVVPDGWHRFAKTGPGARVAAFSPAPLRSDGTFETGFTLQLLWNPRGKEAGGILAVAYTIIGEIDQNKRDNTPLQRGTMEERMGRKVVITRHRNAPPGLIPIVVHRMLIIDEKQSLLYMAIFESPESSWSENWKIGEEILRRIVIAFTQ